MGYSSEERETVLVYSDETKEWTVYSTVGKHIRKIEGLCDLTILESEDGRPIAVQGKLSEKQVSMKKERIISDEQRESMSKRAKKMAQERLN